ncbi:hypothetical protein BGZ94_005245 [Podila epigama]|nr:hypothetical protein BGZ94_005245 [Podila epigama]
MIDVVMEKEYFGIHSHHEKYSVFDAEHNNNSSNNNNNGENLPYFHPEYASSTRAQLNHTLNRLRGPRIGYCRGEYDRVVFVPMQFNVWLTGLVRWCDGLDLRMRKPCESMSSSSPSSSPSVEKLKGKQISRWEQWVVKYRAEQYTVGGRLGGAQSNSYRESSEYHGEMIESRNHNQSMHLDSIHVVNYADGSVSIGRSHERRDYEPRRHRTCHDESMFSFGSSSPLSRISKFKLEKLTKIDRKSKMHMLKIAVIVLVNVILVVKVVQSYQGKSSAPDNQWSENIASYPGGKITIDDLDEIQAPPEAATRHAPNGEHVTEKSENSKRDIDTFYRSSQLKNEPSSEAAVPASVPARAPSKATLAVDYHDVD